jgi:hypothetical protein
MTIKNAIRLMAMVGLVAGLTGCGSLMHPKAGEFLEQAKGSDGIETQINLIKMAEGSIAAARGKAQPQIELDMLHNQLFALKNAGCQVTEEQAKTVPYAKVQTLRREVKTIFHRLWKTREDQAVREVHLDLLSRRLAELRDALQAAKT